MQRLLTCVAALLVLHACNLKGSGTWSDSAGNSGEFKSSLILQMVEGAPLVYKIKLSDGTEEAFKFSLARDEESDPDENATSTSVVNTQGEVIGTSEQIGKTTVFSLTIDDEEIELRLIGYEELSHFSLDTLEIVGKKTFHDGRVLTWKDNLKLDAAAIEEQLRSYEGSE